MKKIAIIWANPYNRNLGVGALAYAALTLVSDTLNKHNQQFEISFIGSSKSIPDSLSINNKVYKFNNIDGLDYFIPKSFAKLILQYKRYKLFKLIFGIDYVLDLGEGDSFSDIYGLTRFNRIFHSKVLFKVLGKKQLLLPQTIGPFKDKEIERKSFKVLESFSSIYARDRKSFNYSNEGVLKGKICESIDVAFYMPYTKVVFNNDVTNIGINVSGLLWHGGYTKNNQFGLKTNYQELIRRVIEYFVKVDNCQVHLVPHVIPNYDHVENDYTVCEFLKNQYPEVIVSNRFKTPIEAKSYISGLDFFTGARMHSTIAAFSSGVPVVPMAYSRKFNGLFKETLKYEYMGDLVNEQTEVVFSSIIDGYKKRDKLSENIQCSLKDIVTPRLENLKNELAIFFNS
jgi:polysaccharide pyruvyl transferase WcaK-like protein